MKAEFKARYLQYLLNQNNNQGFSVFQLLSFIFFLFSLAFITLPVFSTGSNQEKEAEAKHNLSRMLRSQQAYFLEYYTFADSIEKILVLPIKLDTVNYSYRILTTSKNGPFQRLNSQAFPNLNQQVIITAKSKNPQLKSYTGTAFVVPVTNSITDPLFTAICETATPSTIPPVISNLSGSHTWESVNFSCPPGSQLLGK